jgi:hypothetical protein
MIMPLRLNVGISKKLGLPEYSSIGASCHIELELDLRLLEADLDAFQEQVRDVYIACNQAVNDELARHQASSVHQPANGHPAPAGGHAPADGNGPPAPRTGGARGRPRKPATPSQVRALVAIARAQHADLEGILRAEYAVTRPEDLSLPEASQLIDQLKAAAQA